MRIDAEAELEYFRAGGILRLVLAQMLAGLATRRYSSTEPGVVVWRAR